MEKNISFEDRVRAIDWGTFNTAYGPATDVLEQLLQLASDDHKQAKIASHKLWCGLCHQHASISSAAYPALPFILEVFDNADDLLATEILDILWGFAKCSMWSGPHIPEYFGLVKERLIIELPRFELLSKHSDESISFFSSEIIKELSPL